MSSGFSPSKALLFLEEMFLLYKTKIYILPLSLVPLLIYKDPLWICWSNNLWALPEVKQWLHVRQANTLKQQLPNLPWFSV